MGNLPSGTAIPLALPALMSIATAALPANTTIWFGHELPAYEAPLTFQVTEITGDQNPAEVGPSYRREESFSFICSLILYEGGVPDYVAMLTSLMASFVLLSQAVANNPRLTLNGVDAVRFAEVGNFHIVPATDENSQSAITLDFDVRCTQRVTSLS